MGVGTRGAPLFFVLGALMYALVSESQTGLSVSVVKAGRPALALVAANAANDGLAEGCSIRRHQQLAIFNAVKHHTECIGFVLDYCRACNHTCVVYHGPEMSPFSSLPAFAHYYAPLDVRDVGRFSGEHKDYSAAVMITPDENALSAELRQAESHRFIYLTHLTVPGFIKRWQALRIYTTPLGGIPYALPLFAGRAPVTAAERKRNVVYVGAIFDGENVLLGDLSAIAGRLDDLGFSMTIFTSHLGADDTARAAFAAAGGGKVDIRTDVPTEELHEAVGHASFLLIYPNDNSWYLTDRITGAHSLVFSVATPLLTTSRFAAIYALGPETSGTLSGSNSDEMAEAVALFDKPAKYEQLVAAAVAYRARHVRHNRETIESVLRHVPGIGGEDSVTLPLSEQYNQRVIPRKGDP
jgi:hypothetical protein